MYRKPLSLCRGIREIENRNPRREKIRLRRALVWQTYGIVGKKRSLVPVTRKELLAMGKSKAKYYAVGVGRKTGVFRTWEECQAQVCYMFC